MKRFSTYAAVAALALGGLAGMGCERDETATNTNPPPRPAATGPVVDVDVDVNKDKARDVANRTGDAVDRGLDRTGDALSNAADKTKEVAKDVGGQINDAAHRTADATARGVDNLRDNAREAGARINSPKGTAAAPDAEGIRDVIAQVTEAALTKGGLDDIAERFVDADRNRLGQGKLDNHADLDARIDQFRKDWKAKYNQEFDIKDEEAAFPEQSFSITQGEIGRNAATGTTGADRPDSPAADANTNDPGRNIAVVQVASSGGAGALKVPMVHEAPDRWKINVPDTLTAEKLKQNLVSHLNAAGNPAQWPQDVNQAYAQVGHHVLMAVLDQPAR